MKNSTSPRDIEIDNFYNQLSAEDKIRFLIRFAILAPSTHNTQPWLFNVDGSSCKIYYDSSLILPKADPLHRDLFISLGCCVENLTLAAAYYGVSTEVTYGDSREPELAAEISFSFIDNARDQKKYPRHLLETMISRFNARGIFENRIPDVELMKKITAIIKEEYLDDNLTLHMVEDVERIKKIADLTAKGLETAYKYPAFRKEMSGWMHNSLSRARDGLPGYALRMPLILSFIIPTAVRFFNIGKQLAVLNRKSLGSAPLIFVFTAKHNSHEAWMKIGRAGERMMLELNDQGLKTSIFVAAIEIGELYKSLQKILRTDEIPQFLFAAGYLETPQVPTPRHDLSKKLLIRHGR